ncbi:MarR family transcriptional regulator [Nocardia sp. NPDC048505]|uniref:MarR family transcriptional regulator n=1 Tax=unclassified Nocardia TaxID=2637762 RepID=UPI0033CF3F6C
MTRSDRGRIADGLARGLDHAEIGRRLGRPTSTISREIARNGGPGRYSAELAHLATRHRARRIPRRIASAPTPEVSPALLAELTDALVGTGVPRTAAGVMACLLTSETASATAAELARRLHVSAPTVSQAVRLLEEQGMLVRGRDGDSRRQRYFLGDDAGFSTILASVRANQHLADTVRRGAGALGTGTAAGERLETAADLLEQIGADILRSAHRWRADADAKRVRTP